MKNLIVACLLAFAVVVPAMDSAVKAQKTDKKYVLSTKSKKAKNYYILADQAFNKNETDEVVKQLKLALKEDSEFIEAWMMMGDVSMYRKNYPEAINAYVKAIKISPNYSPDNFYYLGEAFFHTKKYDDAKINLQKYLQQPKRDAGVAAKAKYLSDLCDIRNKIMSTPVPFTPINLGDNINTINDEYLPTITADEQVLIITRRELIDKNGADVPANWTEDFYISRKTDNGWSPATNLGPPINTDKNEGAQAISPDGQILIFTACHRDDGLGSCDLYFSQKVGDRWTKPANMGDVVNSKQWESQPSIASDGRTVYFASGRDGGKGSMDIWVTQLKDDGTWSVPENLGNVINTPGNELSPFIHTDNQTLYFASDGREGMGGLDIFYTRKGPDGKWVEPTNIGYPINTEADESSLNVASSGKTAFFASNSLNGKGKYDLYSFELYEAARPKTTTYLKGRVFDKETGIGLAAKFELTDLETNKLVVESFSDAETGGFLVTIPPEKNYALSVSKQGYLFYSENFSLKGKTNMDEPYLKDVPLQPVKEGTVVVMKNIFFETASFALLDESKTELANLISFLNGSPKVKIEISGHTDNVGKDDYNLALSHSRAKSVYEYLIAHGIAKERLTYKGYGEKAPIDTNDTEDGRANNRRTEFKVTGM
ncbi:MAG: OmpA family protein [Bacteroidetes bacterium]|nr:OmpA family protein [Bacteroidota bacterium]MBU1719366.1 OmpA family protein [Bacteroidota bacterium]